jgi:hypothetical protein
VWLKAETSVVIEVEHDEGDDPTDLTADDERRAAREASAFAKWEVDFARPVRGES